MFVDMDFLFTGEMEWMFKLFLPSVQMVGRNPSSLELGINHPLANPNPINIDQLPIPRVTEMNIRGNRHSKQYRCHKHVYGLLPNQEYGKHNQL